MRTLRLILLLILLIDLYSCEKSDNERVNDSIVNTEWTLSKIINNNTGEITLFPEQIDKFYILFKQSGIIELPNYCNYAYGTYNLIGTDSIVISEVGPGTEKGCLPTIAMDWEFLFINALRESNTYSIENNQLKINCSGDYDLVFDFVQSFINSNGQLLICTNSAIINCPFEIKITLNNTIIDTLSAASTYSNNNCQCDGYMDIGMKIELTAGKYSFHATEINCQASNKVNDWIGEIEINPDNCSKIFLDIIK